MRRRRLLLPALALALVPLHAPAAAADPPEVLTGNVVIDPASFVFTPAPSTGPVERFSFSFRATALGPLAGALSERYECLQAGGAVHCRGGGTTSSADGSTGTIRAVLTWTPLPELACSGRSQGRGLTADGERLVWMTQLSPAGPFRATYVARVVHGPG